MARIGIVPWPELGHLLPTLPLAARLEGQGHQVVFLLANRSVQRFETRGLEQLIRARGFEVQPFWTPPMKAVPSQSERGAQVDDNEAVSSSSPVARLAERFGWWELKRKASLESALWLRHLESGLEEEIRRQGLDLLMVDVMTSYLSISARLAAVRAVVYSTMLPWTYDPAVPPTDSSLVPDGSRRVWWSIQWAWLRTAMRAVSRHLDARVRGVGFPSCVYHAPLRRVVASLCRRAGLSPHRTMSSMLTAGADCAPLVRGPVMVLCPREFDLPRAECGDYCFVEASVDLDRAEPPFDWNSLREGAPLIYCTLGSQSRRYGRERVRRFYQVIIDALAQRPDLQGILACGQDLDESDFAGIPGNVRIVKFAPQIAILRRAALAIHHGGLGSTKECALLGVPQLICPGDCDQPGNGARVVYHGLGAMAGLDGLSASEAVRLFDGLIHSDPIREAVGRMQRVFEAAELRTESLAVVERALAGKEWAVAQDLTRE